MKYDPNRNAKLIIPLAIAAWVGGILVSGEGVPAVFEVIYVTAFAVAVPVVVFYLIGEIGWRALARRYRASVPFSGDWQACATGQMANINKFKTVRNPTHAPATIITCIRSDSTSKAASWRPCSL